MKYFNPLILKFSSRDGKGLNKSVLFTSKNKVYREVKSNVYVFSSKRIAVIYAESALFHAFILLTASKAIIFHSCYNRKDTKFLSENTSKQYEYRRHTQAQKPLSDLFFQAYARRECVIFMYFFSATPAHIAKQRIAQRVRPFARVLPQRADKDT